MLQAFAHIMWRIKIQLRVKLPIDCRRKRGCLPGHPQAQTLESSLNITLGCLGRPQAQALASPYSFIHRALTQNLKTSITQNSTKLREIRQYNKINHHFKYWCELIRIHISIISTVIQLHHGPYPPILPIDSSK